MNRSRMADECRELMERLRRTTLEVVDVRDETPDAQRHALGLLMELGLDAVVRLGDAVNEDEPDARECMKAFLLASTIVDRLELLWKSTREQMAA